ncbi:MAG: HAD-IC family P-type ATPase, partial [bacterium]|nr:HAD-IC family P-type ATPase [bacterium]
MSNAVAGTAQEVSPWYGRKLADISHEFGVRAETGLASSEIADRQQRYGLNEIPRGKKLHWWQLFLRQFKSPLIFILLIAAGMSLWLREYMDAAVIILAALVNVVIGFWQEFRSNNTFEKLQAIVKVSSRVRRDGKVFDIDSSELVPGDIIILKAGMKVPADARLISAQEVLANEALLTGESLPTKKLVCDISGSIGIGDRKNMVHMGTIIEKGEATAVVVATGAASEIGAIAHLTVSIEEGATPLQERLSQLGKVISIFVIASAVIIFITGLLEQKVLNSSVIVEMFETAVAVAVAAIPEGLPAALSVVLAISAQRIFKNAGLVKKLIGAETLGSTSVICTDKTGTLTKGKMSVEKSIGITDEARAGMILAFANEAIIVEKGDGSTGSTSSPQAGSPQAGIEVVGEATDVAKLEYFIANKGDMSEANASFPRVAFLPFDEEEKYIASYHSAPSGKKLVFVTGAPERLVGLAVLSEQEKEHLLREVEDHARRG